MPLPAIATSDFRSLLETYRRTVIAYPILRCVTAAQWALESGWGTSDLAKHHKNYGGAKWRTYMAFWATSASYEANDGRAEYCHFDTHAAWIAGYWGRLDVEPSYRGWRNHAISGYDFMRFIGPTWVGTGPEAEARYVSDVLRISNSIADVITPEDFNDPSRTPSVQSAAPPADWDGMLPDKG